MIFMKYIRVQVFLFLFFLPGSALAQYMTVPAENLQALLSTAIANNPELRSSEARWKMYAAKARQASYPDDPMFMFKLQNMTAKDPFIFNRDPQSGIVFGVSQQLPLWGKLGLRKEMAKNESESYRWALEERKLELALMVTEAYCKLWAVDKELNVVDKSLKILDNLVAVTGLRSSAGQGTQQEIYKAGLEKSRMLAMQLSLQQQRRSLEANINYLLYRKLATPVGAIPDFTLPQIQVDSEKLLETALDKRPQLKSLSSLLQKAQAGRRLAQKELLPDVSLSAEYMVRETVTSGMVQDPGENMFSLGLSFTLSLWPGKREAMVAESVSETMMAQEELNAMKNSIGLAINQTVSEYERLRKTVELYRKGIIPQAEQSLQSAMIGYRAGKVEFIMIIEGTMALFNYQRELFDAEADCMMKLARLEALTGKELLPAWRADARHITNGTQAKNPE
jgi:outer membrane protein, heavy metal efflux system